VIIATQLNYSPNRQLNALKLYSFLHGFSSVSALMSGTV